MVWLKKSVLRPKKIGRIARRESIEFHLFLLPWIIGFSLFYAGPILVSFYLSFCKYDLLSPPRFAGLENYRNFIADPLFRHSLKVTVIYSLASVSLVLLVGLGIALLMNQRYPGILLFRAIYYMPAVMSGVSVSLIWIWMYDENFGIINHFLRLIGIRGPNWFSMEWALWALVVMSIWTAGMYMLIYLAGLQNVPTQLYEVATLDGAGFWRKFWHITLPMISPVILFNVVISFIGSFQVFTQAYVMTMGGPANATLFYVLYLFHNAFRYLKMGYASAQAWVLLVVVMVITLVIFKTLGRWVYYEGMREGKR
ncbi:Lactose transport system permease protein LacF [subsurface metagenome]